MSERTELHPGSFCWPELATTDSAKAGQFYAGLFGWSPVEVPSSGGSYTLLQLRGKDVAGMRLLGEAERNQGVPPHFLTYVSTASANAAAERAAALGGTVLGGPFDVEGIGRMAVVRDPQGVVFALWEARGHIGARVVGEPGTLCWSELVTPDPDAAEVFYGGLLGWTFRPFVGGGGPAGYTVILREQQEVGGILPMKGKWWADVPPHWMPYFLVGDADATAAKAAELGGGAAVPPTAIPGVGRFAVLRDATGAHFSVLAPAPVPEPAAA